MPILFFLLKLVAASGILLGYYWLALRNRNFHRYNRFYLLAAVATSLVMPFVSIDFLVPAHEPAGKLFLETFEIIAVTDAPEPVEQAFPALLSLFSSWTFWGLVLYTVGTLFMGVLLYRSLRYISRLRKSYPRQLVQDLSVYQTTEPGTPFSFFRSIFWNQHISVNSTEGQQIFRHELYHVKQQHSADLLFMELVILLAWFNPFYYLIRRELKVIHEFLADEHAASGGDEYAYAELLVLFALQEKQQQLVHPFFHHTIKRRITMLTHINKQKMGYWSRIMALPLSLFLFSFIVIKAQQLPAPPGSSDPQPAVAAAPITLLLDAGHGGSMAGALSADKTIAEKDLNLILVRKIATLAPEYGIKTVLTRTDDIDVKHTDRIATAKAVAHDFMLSIHLDATVPAGKNGGIEAYISRNENELRKASAQLATALLTKLGEVYRAQQTVRSRQTEGIYILDNAVKPAVLLECGYINNPKDLAFILDPANQEKLARGILETIAKFGGQQKEPAPRVIQQEQDSVPQEKDKPYVRTMNRPEKKSPNPSAWASWKDGKTYGVWLNDKRISNESLNQYKPDEIAWFNVSKLYGKAKDNVSYTYQVSLVTKEYYQKIFSKEKYTIELKPATAKNKNTVELSDSLKWYIQRHLNRNLHYPEQAIQQNRTSINYFSMEADANGNLSGLQFYDKEIKGQPLLGCVVISYARGSKPPIGPAEGEIRQLFIDEITRTMRKYQPPAGWKDPKGAGRIYFIIEHMLEANDAQKSVTQEPQ